MYGLAVFAQMTRHGAYLFGSTLTQPTGAHLKAWAVAFAGAIRVLVINKGASSANVSLRLGVQGHAFVKRLLAPRIGAATGVTFGGQTIGPDGRWHGKLHAPAVSDKSGTYTVNVPGYSAAMVTLFH
jgi:Glycosyl hydrolase family 79 C-terminal beta domain